MAYTYDDNRNLLSVAAPNAPWLDQSFTYDSHNRLTQAQGRYGNIAYTYDPVGNRLTRSVNTRTETYAYVPDTNRIQEITGHNPITFTLDAAGNVTAMGARTLVYNQHHRLVRVEEGTEVLGEYTYNGLGQRAVKEANGETTIFLYDMNGKLVAEANETGTITAEYLYMGKIRMAKADPATGNLYFYLNDRLGTPLMMTDETNTVVWEAMVRPFGETMVNPNSTVVNHLRLPGQYYDEETGLHYNYHRYYDPRTGRYLRADPIGQLGGVNIFVYAANNPIMSMDPLGLRRKRISIPNSSNIAGAISDFHAGYHPDYSTMQIDLGFSQTAMGMSSSISLRNPEPKLNDTPFELVGTSMFVDLTFEGANPCESPYYFGFKNLGMAFGENYIAVNFGVSIGSPIGKSYPKGYVWGPLGDSLFSHEEEE